MLLSAIEVHFYLSILDVIVVTIYGRRDFVIFFIDEAELEICFVALLCYDVAKSRLL